MRMSVLLNGGIKPKITVSKAVPQLSNLSSMFLGKKNNPFNNLISVVHRNITTAPLMRRQRAWALFERTHGIVALKHDLGSIEAVGREAGWRVF